MLQASIQKNDKKAGWLIGIFSFVVFAVVVSLGRIHLQVDLGFDIHIFATINAVINSIIAVLLVAALIAVKNKNYLLHKKMMMASLVLSILFLVSYIAHHLLAGDTKFGGEGIIRTIYYIILITHIFLAAVILPFILYTAYRALTGEFDKHKKLAKITWPLWFYVAVTGPIVYLLISPYYQ
jgi:putative membrane protein